MDKIFNYFNTQFNNLKKSSPKQLLYAFGIAFISWLVISMSMYPNTPKTISNIPLEVDISGTSAEANDLSIISKDVEKVKVKITGDTYEVGTLKSEDLIASAVVENVTQSGVYQLKITVTSIDGVEFTVNSIEPAYVTVEFDKYITKEVPITINAPNIKAKDGYIMDENSPQVTPPVINITGPKKQVEDIAEFSVDVKQEKELDNYYTYHSTNEDDWKIYNENGGELDFTGITYDLKDIQIDFQAYMTKTLKLTYTLLNAPSTDFQPNFNMSVEEIVVASSDSSLETTDEISIGYIDMNEVDLNYSKDFDIELPSSYRNISGINTVTVSLNSNNYTKREFSNLTNFAIVNAPSNYDIELVSENLTVEIIAPSYIIDVINQDDFVLKVDLSSVQITGSLFPASVTVQIPNYPEVWSVGKYTVSLRATEKAITTTSDDNENVTTANTLNSE